MGHFSVEIYAPPGSTLSGNQHHKVILYLPRGDKRERLGAITPLFEGGHVRLPRYAPWLEEFVQELCGFPSTRHDDQVASTSQALDYLKVLGPGEGFLAFIKSEMESWDDDDDWGY